MRISRTLLDEMIEHALEEAPNECCGMVSVQDGEAVNVYRARNAQASPLRFEIDGRELGPMLEEIEQEHELGAIYHSHTRTAPEPSQTDINFAKGWPGVLWIIVGVANGSTEVRIWRIDDGQVSEAELIVE